MAESPSTPGLLEWSLATFHTTFLVAALLTLLYLSGELGALLGSLNTLIGVGIFVVLWATTRWTTGRALRAVGAAAWEQRVNYREWLYRGVIWGGVNGVAFLLVLLAIAFFVLIILTMISPERAGGLFLLLLFGLVGSLFAFVIGGAFGLILAVVDAVMLEASRAIFLALKTTASSVRRDSRAEGESGDAACH